MIKNFFLKAVVFLWMVSFSSGIGNSTAISEMTSSQNPETILSTEQKEGDPIQEMKIQIGNKTFTATLYDQDSVRKFIERLPMTIEMSELNRNEKYYYMEDPLPTNSEKVGNIDAGEIMLYGSDCLVLFYDSFSTPYSYTRIGKIDDIQGFKEALGDGTISVTFLLNDSVTENTDYPYPDLKRKQDI